MGKQKKQNLRPKVVSKFIFWFEKEVSGIPVSFQCFERGFQGKTPLFLS